MANPFNFTHALCRSPAPSAVKGIRADGGPDPDFTGLVAEHEAYVAGAPSRAGEVEHIREPLAARHSRLLEMTGPGYADGGDILRLADRVIIGLSARTDRTGAEELAALLGQLGYPAQIAETPPGVLHFKTGCGLIDQGTILAVPALADCPEFAGLEAVTTPPGEEPAANILRIGDTVLIGDRWPATHALLAARGIAIRTLPTEQIAHIDAGLSCMSLRW